ncbi:hypothetical protein [Pseudalkalibacillus berkeleyi]|uniref:Uncharacterized protein n=1 Tax=Pseudalkalibacillus berkeleyi TaxID=1069813 RepID=A0ABS9GYB0_9BACL|nr:hypothetical protein [Pseudalkalibacillus berkeleyi]MCF6136680.1 hypothetical protein [Pseudalkalibacillus berkeleyi]
MYRFFCKYGLWILFIVVGSGVISNFFYYRPYSKTDIVALIFGVIGLAGLLYLAIHQNNRNKA